MLVSSFLLQSSGHTTHSVEKYFHNFNRMRAVIDIPMILFVDRTLSTDSLELKNVNIIRCSLEETDTYELIQSCANPVVQVSDNPSKNTKDFHIIMNSKTEFMVKAMDITDSRILSWVDFGIGHVIKDEKSFLHLKKLHSLEGGVHIPGAWNYKTTINDHPAWRFCGGFYVGDRESLRGMHELSRRVIRELLPIVTWEVNIWSMMESIYGFNFHWYYAGHDDGMLCFPLSSKV